MGEVVLAYDLADGRRLELDAGPFTHNGVEVGPVWWLVGPNRLSIGALEHEEIVYDSCESDAQQVASNRTLPR